jgi:hypothetical protein
MKFATLRLHWVKSPSMDIDRVELRVNVNGSETITTLSGDTEEFTTEVSANSVISFDLKVFDTEGKEATSQTFTKGIGDLEDPLPPTDLGIDILAVRDDTDVSSTGTETSTSGEFVGRGGMVPRRVAGR